MAVNTFERLAARPASSDVSNRFEFVSDVMSITFGNAGRRMIGDVRRFIVRTNVSLPTEHFSTSSRRVMQSSSCVSRHVLASA
jgi:hypothetical protein